MCLVVLQGYARQPFQRYHWALKFEMGHVTLTTLLLRFIYPFKKINFAPLRQNLFLNPTPAFGPQGVNLRPSGPQSTALRASDGTPKI